MDYSMVLAAIAVVIILCVIIIVILTKNKKKKENINNMNTVINNAIDDVLENEGAFVERKSAYRDGIELDEDDNSNVTKNLSSTSSIESKEASAALEEEMKNIREEIKKTIGFEILDDVMLAESEEDIL